MSDPARASRSALHNATIANSALRKSLAEANEAHRVAALDRSDADAARLRAETEATELRERLEAANRASAARIAELECAVLHADGIRFAAESTATDLRTTLAAVTEASRVATSDAIVRHSDTLARITALETERDAAVASERRMREELDAMVERCVPELRVRMVARDDDGEEMGDEQ